MCSRDVFDNQILPEQEEQERVCETRERERRSLCMLHHISELNASQAGVRGRGRQSAEV